MSAKKIFTKEKEDVYFKDIKEKLSDVHISVIEVSQALQGRKFEEAKDKIDNFVKLAQDTQRDFNLYLERVGREGRKEGFVQPRLEKGTSSEASVAGPSTIRRNSIRIYSDSDDSEQEIYVATTSAQVRDFREKEAIIQAIKDLETEDHEEGGHRFSGDHPGILEQELINDIAKDSKSSAQTKAALSDLFVEQTPSKKEKEESNGITEETGKKKQVGAVRSGLGLGSGSRRRASASASEEEKGETFKPNTSNRMREELDRAALDMAERELALQKMKKEPGFEEQNESFTWSDSREKERLEPTGGPMSFRHKKQFIQDWLSTDDHNLIELLERRQSTGSDLSKS